MTKIKQTKQNKLNSLNAPINIALISILNGIIILEAFTALLYWLMAVSRFPLPWGWVPLAQEGFTGEVFVSIGITLYLYACIIGYFKKGLYRYLSLQALIAFILLIAGLWLGGLLFKFWTGIAMAPKPWQLFGFFDVFPIHTTMGNQLVFFLLVGVVLSLGAIAAPLVRKHLPERSLLGDAHFASAPEIHKAGFFNKNGIIVGKAWGQALRAGGFEHVLVFSPAGSGKTTAIAVPNLLSWPHSCVVNDTKYELFELTSGHRQQAFQNNVFLWAPTRQDGKTHRYNPLKFISNDRFKRISDIQLMGHVLIPNGQGEPIWYQSARELFLALVLYLLDTTHHATTFAELYNLSKQHQFNHWLEDKVKNTTDSDPEFYRNASSYLNTAEKTRASILKTFTGYLEIFANPIINAATSDSDFDLRELRKKKMTIYIGFPDNEKEMISPLLTLFWQQLISFMTEKLPNEQEEPYPLLCLMDEFSTLGRLVNLKNSLKLLRGYRVRVVIIVQYLAQTLELYSQAEAESFKNIKTKVAFALDSYEDAEYLSKLLGNQTKRITNRGLSHQEERTSTSKNMQLQSLPLMRPEEIMRMKPNQALILRTGHPPVKATQLRWYQSRQLKHLPCGEIDVPIQMPVIVPFEPREDDDTEVKPKASWELDEKALMALDLE